MQVPPQSQAGWQVGPDGFWQYFPCQSGVHSQTKLFEFPTWEQVTPFKQGLDAHGLAI